MRPEDRELFIAGSIVEPVLQVLKVEAERSADKSPDPKSNAYLKLVIKELKSQPYLGYSVLRYPHLF